MLLGYSPRYGGLLYIINVLKFFLVMNAKEFLGGLLEENKPQVVSFQNGADEVSASVAANAYQPSSNGCRL